MIRFGVHCSVRGGLTSALEEAHSLGCEALQIFTRSPRMWHVRFPDEREVAEFIKLRAKYKIFPLVVHTPYLPNLATTEPRLAKLSYQALEDDLETCRKIMADIFVIHPGSYSLDSTLEEGIKYIAEALNRACERIKGDNVVLLENVAGGGRRIGSSFNEISEIIGMVTDKRRIGVCLDTAHALGAGFDMASPEGIDKMLRQFDKCIGREYLKCLHLNDSKAPIGSGKDRHEHLGKGFIGLEGFRYLISKVKLTAQAGILETPKDSPVADKQNLHTLFSLR
jgi:deoxyribonuclease-4